MPIRKVKGGWKIKNTSGVYAQYDDLVYENSQNDRFLKTYTYYIRF